MRSTRAHHARAHARACERASARHALEVFAAGISTNLQLYTKEGNRSGSKSGAALAPVQEARTPRSVGHILYDM